MFKIIVNVILLFILLGCGSSSSTKTITFTGQEIDGLKQVRNGDEVSFYVGDILLAKVSNAPANMTLFDLAGVTAPVKAHDVKKSIKENSLNKVMNITSFLQTIDKDGDASNGIAIPKELDVLTKHISLDFNASTYSFSHSFALKKLMAEGRKKGIWEEDRHIVKPYVALDALYASLNLKPEIFVVKSQTHLYQLNDSNDTGTSFDSNAYEARIDSNITYVYNSLGNLESMFEDGTNFSTVKKKKILFYDKYFNQIREKIYLDSKVEIRLDANGNAFYSSEESNGTYTLHQIKEQRHNFNADLLTSRTKDVKDGYFTDRNITISYNEYGNLITYERSNYHPFISYRNVKLCGSSEYNSLGLKTLEKFDRNCDGIDNQLTQYIYDSANRTVTTLYDSEADGLIDTNLSVVFYGGKKTETMLTYTDGVVNSKYIYIYNNHEHIIYNSYERNGIVYNEDNSTYTYSSTGNILREEVHNKDGVLSKTFVTSYDDLDNVLVTEHKDIINDIVIYKARYTYDINGYKLVSEVFQDSYNEYREVFTYDTFGNELTYQKITEQGEDIIKIVRSRNYVNTFKWISLSYFFEEQ